MSDAHDYLIGQKMPEFNIYDDEENLVNNKIFQENGLLCSFIQRMNLLDAHFNRALSEIDMNNLLKKEFYYMVYPQILLIRIKNSREDIVYSIPY